jgi:hypothetical protein
LDTPTIGYGMTELIWFSMSFHGSLGAFSSSSHGSTQIDFLVGIRQSVGKPLFTPFFSDQPSLIYRPSISYLLLELVLSSNLMRVMMNLHPSFMRVNMDVKIDFWSWARRMSKSSTTTYRGRLVSVSWSSTRLHNLDTSTFSPSENFQHF